MVGKEQKNRVLLAESACFSRREKVIFPDAQNLVGGWNAQARGAVERAPPVVGSGARVVRVSSGPQEVNAQLFQETSGWKGGY